MPQPKIELIVAARNEATRQLAEIVDQFGVPIQRATQQLQQAAQEQSQALARVGTVALATRQQIQGLDAQVLRMDQSLRTTGAGVRALAVPLAMQLEPALGTTASRIAGVVSASAAMGSGWAGLAVAGAGLAGMLGGALLSAWQRNRDEVVAFDRAIRNADVGFFTSKLKELQAGLDEAGLAYAKARAEFEKVSAQRATEPRSPTGYSRAVDIATIREGQSAEARKALIAALDALDKAKAEYDQARATQAELDALASTAAIVQQAESERIWGARSNRLADRGLYDFTLSPADAEYAKAQREAEDRRMAGDEAGAQRLLAAADARRRKAFEDRARERRRELDLAALSGYGDEGLAYARPTAADLLQQEQISDRIRREMAERAATERNLRAIDDPLAGVEAAAMGRATPDDERQIQEAGRRGAVDLARQQADAEAGLRDVAQQRLLLDEARLDVLSQLPGLTETEQRALDALVTAGQEQAEVARVRLDTEQRIADLLLRQKAAADDPAQVAALEEQIAATRRLGKEREALVVLSGGMRQAQLAQAQAEQRDAFAGLLAGLRDVEDQFGGLGSRMRDLATSTASAMSAAFSTGFFDVLTGQFKSLPQLGQQFGAAMLRAITDELGKLATGAILSPLRGALLGTGSGGSLLPFLGSTGMMLAPTGALASTTTAGGAQAAYAGLTPDGLLGPWGQAALPILQLPAAGGGQLAPTGSVLGSAWGGFGALAGLAASAWGAYQSGNVLTGAVGGLTFGALAGTIFPGPGTVIGALAGGLIGAGAGALGKTNDATAARRQARLERAQAVLDQYRAIVDAKPATLAEAGDALAQPERRSGARLGDVLLFMAQGPHIPDTGVALTERPDLAARLMAGGFVPAPNQTRFGDGVDSITELIAVSSSGTGNDAADGARVWEQLLDEFERGLDAILQREAGVLFQFAETLPVRGGPGITRTTILPFSRRLRAPGGADLSLIQETILGLDDETKAAFLQELARVDANQDLQIIYRGDDSGRVVRSQTYTYVAPPAPPVPAPVGSAPDAGGSGAPPVLDEVPINFP